jgi:MarR family transcriptional regulator, organic hydroperoxide resistance regulator
MAKIKQKIIENISDDLIGILPIIHKKLMSFLNEGIEFDLSHYHFAILGILSKSDALPVSEIGRRLLISKPQMTAILDKLVDLKLVSRSQIPEDRRVIYISLTPQGKQVLAKALENIRHNLAVKLAGLNEVDLLAFAASLKTIKEVGSRID